MLKHRHTMRKSIVNAAPTLARRIDNTLLCSILKSYLLLFFNIVRDNKDAAISIDHATIFKPSKM